MEAASLNRLGEATLAATLKKKMNGQKPLKNIRKNAFNK